MNKRITSALFVLAIAFSFSTSSFAQSKGKKIDTARSAPISLVEGIQKIEERMDGQVFEIEFDRKSKRDVYEAYVSVNNNVYEIYIDITNGQLIKQSQKNKKTVRLGKPLVELIEIATKTQPGTPYEAECKTKKKRVMCEIGIYAQNDDVYEVTVDGTDGSIISIELD